MDTPNSSPDAEGKGPSPTTEAETPTGAADATPSPGDVPAERGSRVPPPLLPPPRSAPGLSGVRTPVMALDSSAIVVSPGHPTLFDKLFAPSEVKAGRADSKNDKPP